ncbi:hypothetical protein F5X97DRAFT_329866 [Nemania serpens]|nr:hypothetical protein F5X97DRAFT_329866 [Nemania serpens]
MTLDVIEQASNARRSNIFASMASLTLTEASRAYLMESQWNSTLEEQALARVHRLGQMREVTTGRFYMRDTFEERVMELQKKKEDLAGLLSDPQARNTEYLEDTEDMNE